MHNLFNVKEVGIKILSICIGFILIAGILMLTVTNDTSNIPKVSTSKDIGKEMSNYKLATIYKNGKTSISYRPFKGIWIILSAKCPHCQNILKTLNNGKMVYSSLNIYPIFKEKVLYNDIYQLISKENINYPVYKIYNNSVIDSIKYVPTFLYINNNRIVNSITGGISTEIELQNLLASLINRKWKKVNTSIAHSACSL